MKLSLWRKCALGVLSVSLFNMGMMSAASAAIVDTSALVTTDREADLGAIHAQLARAEVRAQMEQMGVDAAAVEQRVARLNDRELHQLAADMRNAPAGGDGALALIGAVFVVLLILELTGVIDIFKKR
ncbi:MAG TPA: PA2779 family protein [Steroidobacteraceae bacterium]|nr:PA2779 family protein [Steroidobacteraceae bacterium]